MIESAVEANQFVNINHRRSSHIVPENSTYVWYYFWGWLPLVGLIMVSYQEMPAKVTPSYSSCVLKYNYKISINQNNYGALGMVSGRTKDAAIHAVMISAPGGQKLCS